MFLNKESEKSRESFKIYQIFKKKIFLNVSAELDMENSICLISVHSFIEKPTVILFILNVKI